MADGAPLVHEDWEGYDGGRQPRPRRQHARLLARSSRATPPPRWPTADVVVKGRYVADASQGAPIEPRALIAQWQGDDVTVWSSTQVPFAARSGVAHTLQMPESHVRIIVPLLGGGFGAKCDFHFEAPRRRARPGRAAAREARLLAPRGVHRARPPPRGHGHRARDRRQEATARSSPAAASSCSTRAPTAARAASSRRWRRCTRCGPYKHRERRRRLVPGLHEQPAVALDPRPHGAAGLLGARAAHGRGRRARIEHGSRRAAPPHADRGGRRGADAARSSSRIGMKETLEKAVELIGYGQDLPEDEAIGVACGWWPSLRRALGRVREAQRRRLAARSSPARRRAAPAP